jgi:single-strand DNA-binding protein
MANLNKVFLIGNLTRDPELRYTSSGVAVSDLGLATNRMYTTKDGERREETLFIDVTVWNRQAENCCQYLKKGRQIHVEGYLKTESWETQTGEKRTKVKVEAERVQFLDRRDAAESGAPAAPDDDYAPPSAREPRRGAPAPDARAGNGAGRGHGPSAPAPRRPSAPPPASDSEDDDIPF